MTLHYDLHTHSSASDGILSPEALVSRAKDKGVTHLALTDHDTLDGIGRARLAASECGLDIISGVEFSTQWQGKGIHIVGLYFDEHSPAITQAVHKQRDTRLIRAEEIDQRLQKLGVEGALEGAQQAANGAVVGRPHFAEYLVAKGYVKDMNGAFKKYLGAGKAGDVKHGWLSMDEVITAIASAGGVACLAHPLKYEMTLTKLRALLAEFKSAGGGALEVVSGAQLPNQTEAMAKLCERFELLASCGSDFHNPNHGWQELGSYATLPAQVRPVWQYWH